MLKGLFKGCLSFFKAFFKGVLSLECQGKSWNAKGSLGMPREVLECQGGSFKKAPKKDRKAHRTSLKSLELKDRNTLKQP